MVKKIKTIKSPPSIPTRTRLLLKQWRENLSITNLEKNHLLKQLKYLDLQLERLNKKHLRIAVFGKVGTGKTSLINALLNESILKTDIAHGSTSQPEVVIWNQSIPNLNKIEFIDTPGIDEIKGLERSKTASQISMKVDLTLFVLDSDITSIEIESLKYLAKSAKPILIILNRSDQWSIEEQDSILKSIRSRLPLELSKAEIITTASSPRKGYLQKDGKVRSKQCKPLIEGFRTSLKRFLSVQGELLLALNSLRESELFSQSLKRGRLERRKKEAQGLIGRFATIKASGVAINPLLILDLAGAIAFDTTLVLQLSQLYGLHLKGNAARKLLSKLAVYNSFLGGAQISIQIALSVLKQFLILASPFTGGLSLASATPVALIQAAIAIHTTKLTGKLAARELLLSSQKDEIQPQAMLRRFTKSDPAIRQLAGEWPRNSLDISTYEKMQTLLP